MMARIKEINQVIFFGAFRRILAPSLIMVNDFFYFIKIAHPTGTIFSLSLAKITGDFDAFNKAGQTEFFSNKDNNYFIIVKNFFQGIRQSKQK